MIHRYRWWTSICAKLNAVNFISHATASELRGPGNLRPSAHAYCTYIIVCYCHYHMLTLQHQTISISCSVRRW